MSAQPSDAVPPVNRHKLTAVERQRAQLDRLLKDPNKAAYVPPPPKEKTIRPAREMMKNVQGSSAGAGSGEFHVYKASRRREYERLSLLEEATRQETEDAEFKRKREEAEAIAEAKTAKNRAKRQKKKQGKSKNAASEPVPGTGSSSRGDSGDGNSAPLKKRRLVNGRELVFRKQGEDSDAEESDEAEQNIIPDPPAIDSTPNDSDAVQSSAAASKIIIHEDD